MQATPGASLTPAGAGSPFPSRRTALALIVAACGLALDVGTKVLAVDRLEGEPSRRLVGDLLRLTFTRNPGAAFSAGESATPIIATIAVVAAVAVLWFVWRVRSTSWALALGLILAGIVGNLADRIFRAPGPFHGHVVDFLQLPHWPIFNIADICINIGAVLVVVLSLRGIGIDGSRAGDHAGDSVGDHAAERREERHDG